MKRFYKLVSVSKTGEGFGILLDGKPVRTPGKNLLQASTQKLADALMQEWADQKDVIKPAEMRLTQIASTMIDQVSQQRAAMTKAVMGYLDTDLLCYRAPTPPELVVMQTAAWDPWLGWMERTFGAAPGTTETLVAFHQPDALHITVRNHIENLGNDYFTVLQIVTPLTGSLILALAFTAQAIPADEAFRAARVEESYKATLYNEDRHGPDPAQDKKDRAALADLEACQKFLVLLK